MMKILGTLLDAFYFKTGTLSSQGTQWSFDGLTKSGYYSLVRVFKVRNLQIL